MIEQLLLRIARRGAPLSTNVSSEPDSSALPQRSEPPLPFPAKRLTKLTNTTAALDNFSAWQEACAAFHAQTQDTSKTNKLPPAFADYTAADAQVGAQIYMERHRLETKIVHLHGKTGLLIAAIDPRRRQVLVRKSVSEEEAEYLSWRELPASANMLGFSLHQQFRESTPYMLLWYYGQAMHEATQAIPQELLSGRLMLRKLPLVDPRALDLRHLQLIHIFSGGSFSFPELLQFLEADAIPWICADIASLYLTGCLVTATS